MEYGKIAYDAYGDARGWITFKGDKMPSWEEQDEGLRKAWVAAAEAVVKAVGEANA